MEKLTDEQLGYFISRASPQLTPELTHQMFSIIQELIIYRSRKNEKREEKLMNLVGNMERICALSKYFKETGARSINGYSIECALECMGRDIEDARLNGVFVGTTLAMPYKYPQKGDNE